MGLTCEAIAVEGNHDWDFEVDELDNITALNVNGVVTWQDADGTLGRLQILNIWPQLNQTQKDNVQQYYNGAKQIFDNHFLGG